MPSHALTEYADLLEKFLGNQIPTIKFEREYLALFKSDDTIRPEPEFLILDRLFSSVDAFCSDPEICDQGDLSEDQLRQECRDALTAINDISHNRGGLPGVAFR